MMKHYCTYFVLWNFSLYLGLITSVVLDILKPLSFSMRVRNEINL